MNATEATAHASAWQRGMHLFALCELLTETTDGTWAGLFQGADNALSQARAIRVAAKAS